MDRKFGFPSRSVNSSDDDLPPGLDSFHPEAGSSWNEPPELPSSSPMTSYGRSSECYKPPGVDYDDLPPGVDAPPGVAPDSSTYPSESPFMMNRSVSSTLATRTTIQHLETSPPPPPPPPPPAGSLRDDALLPPGLSVGSPIVADENSQYSFSGSLSEPDSDDDMFMSSNWRDELPPGIELARPVPPPPPPVEEHRFRPDIGLMQRLALAQVKVEFIDLMVSVNYPKDAYEALCTSPNPNLLCRELIKKGLLPKPDDKVLADLPPLELFNELEGNIFPEGINSILRHTLPYMDEETGQLTKIPPNAIPLSQLAFKLYGVVKEQPKSFYRIPSPEPAPWTDPQPKASSPPPPEPEEVPIPPAKTRAKQLLLQKRLELARKKEMSRLTPAQMWSLRAATKKDGNDDSSRSLEYESRPDESSQESVTTNSARSSEDVDSESQGAVRQRLRLLTKRAPTPPKSTSLRSKIRSGVSLGSDESSDGCETSYRPKSKAASVDKKIFEKARVSREAKLKTESNDDSTGVFTMKIQTGKGLKDSLRKLSFGAEEEDDEDITDQLHHEEKRRLEQREQAKKQQHAETKPTVVSKATFVSKPAAVIKPAVVLKSLVALKPTAEEPVREISKAELRAKRRKQQEEELLQKHLSKTTQADLAPVASSSTSSPVVDLAKEEEKRLIAEMLETQAKLQKLQERHLQLAQKQAALPSLISQDKASPDDEKYDAQEDVHKSEKKHKKSKKKKSKAEKKKKKKKRKKSKKNKRKRKSVDCDDDDDDDEQGDEDAKRCRIEIGDVEFHHDSEASSSQPASESDVADARISDLQDDEIIHILDRTLKRHLKFPVYDIRNTSVEPSLIFSANPRHGADLAQIIDNGRPIALVSAPSRDVEYANEMMDDMEDDIHDRPPEKVAFNQSNLIRIPTVENPPVDVCPQQPVESSLQPRPAECSPEPQPDEGSLEARPVVEPSFQPRPVVEQPTYRSNLLEVPIVCAAESTSAGCSPPGIPTPTQRAPPQEQESPESTTGPPKPCILKSRRTSAIAKSVSFFDGTAPEKDPFALSPPPPPSRAAMLDRRRRISLLPSAASVYSGADYRSEMSPPPPPPALAEPTVLYALDPINKHVYEIVDPGNGLAITPGGSSICPEAQKYIYGEVVHTEEMVLVENFLHFVYRFPYLIDESE